MSATIASMFHVRCIHPDQGRIEANRFELQPTNSQGEAVCDLFRRYLADRPATFRDKLPFLRKGDIELDWSAATGGVLSPHCSHLANRPPSAFFSPAWIPKPIG